MVRFVLTLALASLTVTFACRKTEDFGTQGARQSAPPPTPSQPTDPKGPALDVPASMTPQFIRSQVEILADDAMRGRRPGTDGGQRAVQHIISVMTAIGLNPAGENGGWTQTVPMRATRVDVSGTRMMLAGRGEPRLLEFGPQFVAAREGSAGTTTVSAPLVFAGYGVTAPEQDWDDYGKTDLRGKVVVVFIGDPPVDGRFGGPAMTYYGRWGYKFERALEAGAAGCLVIHEDKAASYGWNVVQNSWSGERFDIVEDGKSAPSLAIQGWISRDVATLLAKRSGQSLERWHEIALQPGFKPIETGVTLEGRLVTTERPLSDVNVLGRLPGAAKAEQAIFITAHWDHLGVKDEVAAGEDAIFNGAIDNASGIAGMLAVAAELSGRQSAPKRSVVFMATTAEEQGLLGSRYYAAHPLVPIKDIVAVINLDSMNVHGETKTVQIVGNGQTSLEETLTSIAAKTGRTVIPDERPEAGSYYRSDHFAFAARGVPAIYFRGGKDMVQGGTAAGDEIAAEHARIYHTVDDEFDPSWSFAGTVQDASMVAELVAQVANADETPRWNPDSEFARLR